MARRRKPPSWLQREMMTGHELWVEDDKRQEREMWRERAALAKRRISDRFAEQQRATFTVIERPEGLP